MKFDLADMLISEAFVQGNLENCVMTYKIAEGKKVTLILDNDGVEQFLEVYGIEVFFKNDNLYYRVDCGWYKTTRYNHQKINLLIENRDFKPK